MAKIEVLSQAVTVQRREDQNYISLTDIARYKDADRTDYLIMNWMRNRNTIEFLGIWEHLIKEFQRLKESERQSLDWDIRRNLAKINYRIHNDAIKGNLIPATLTRAQAAIVYANEADVLNVALFGLTAKQWRDANSGKKGNIRDEANGAQLVCLSNLESLNAELIKQGLLQADRLIRLNEIAIGQMKILVEDTGIRRLKGNS